MHVCIYVCLYVCLYVLSMFRDLESGLSKDLKDGEPCLKREKRWWRLVAILTFTSFVMLGEKGR